MKFIDKLIDKVLESDAKILNPSWRTLEIMGYVGLALIPISWTLVVIALLTL